jgi:hypothetical protein
MNKPFFKYWYLSLVTDDMYDKTIVKDHQSANTSIFVSIDQHVAYIMLTSRGLCDAHILKNFRSGFGCETIGVTKIYFSATCLSIIL